MTTLVGGNRLKNNSISLSKLTSGSHTDDLTQPSNKLADVNGIRNYIKVNNNKLSVYDETINYAINSLVLWGVNTYKSNTIIVATIEGDLSNSPSVSIDWDLQETNTNLITEFKHEILHSYTIRKAIYDAEGNIVTLEYRNSSNVLIYSIDYVYNNNNNLIEVTITALSNNQTIVITHNYDINNRWIGETYA